MATNKILKYFVSAMHRNRKTQLCKTVVFLNHRHRRVNSGIASIVQVRMKLQRWKKSNKLV